MCKRAGDFGAEIQDGARLMGIDQKDDQIRVKVKKDGQQIELSSTCLIGADGADSTVRKAVFPDFKPMKAFGYRLCYDSKLDLPEYRFNIFQSLGSDLRFYVHNKGNQMFLEGVAYEGHVKETIEQAKQFLMTHHGFDPQDETLWKDGCMECPMYMELAAGTFKPASGNVLIIGDAAGLHIPVTGEGLATSMKAGMDAAEAVVSAAGESTKAESIYLERVDRLLAKFHDIAAFGKRVEEAAATENPELFSRALMESWDYALKLL
jgi:flavin-dependent dehydrogenase